jgi:hypothetical protein
VSAAEELTAVARASFALASMGRRELLDTDVERLRQSFGAQAASVALRVHGELLLQEAAALEAFGAVRKAGAA